ncbi:MAG TPA: Hpt domain-containing protein, partial [Steroidobacteraceae bacterium]|nr:Hpt domain-containing protein [Steroidobacteraceae bacterium]
MTEVSSQTLHVVSKELGTTLNEARVALENFAEHPETTKLLEQCAQQLHQAHGVLRMVEVYGAALLAEEMEQVTRYLVGATSADKNQAEGLDALMRAMVQLPAYLERVLSGGRDLALVLLPLLNDLRAVRGSSLLSEGTLLLLNLKSDQQATPSAPRAGEAPLTVVQWARRLRARFQVGLLGWIRGERVTQNLEILGRVAEKLEQVATTQAVFQLWWAVGAVLEALREEGLNEGATIKRLMGLADREIKRLYVQGEARYGETPPLDLLNNLLYYVARANSRGARVMAVRASFKLGELLPVDDSVEQERESLSAPSVKLMRTVGAAIKEDLSKVKDVLDIFVRKGGTQVDELAPQLDLLRKISDTLGVLGLGGLRTRVQNEIQQLQGMLSQGTPTNDSSLVQMAATLISVEDSLDDQLVRLILPTAPAQAAAQPESDGEGGPDTDYQQVTGAVMRECIVNLARIKDAITLSVQKPTEAQGLDQIPQLLRGITAGLLMLGKARAVEIVENIAQLMQDMLQPGVRPPPDRMDRFADAIVSIEYYMETVQSGRSDPWYMLDNAEMCLKALQQMHTTVVPAGLPPDSGVHTRTIAVDTAHPAAAAKPRVDTTATDPAAERQAASHPVLATSETRKLDPEFLALFIEEAREEVASINRQFQLWDQNPADSEALVSVRRSFHTLKGSGRMVGAMLLGAFSWSVENLLNRIIAKTLIRTPGMMTVLREAVRALPQLVEQLENGRASDFDIANIMARAQAFAEGREADQVATGTMAPEDLAHGVETFSDSAPRQATNASPREGPRPTTPAPPAMDPVLHDIYSRESAGHLATLRDYIRKNTAVPAPWKVPEAVYRACHTLSGSSKMADARHGIRIAEPLNHYMRRVFDSGVGLDAAGIDVLRKSVDAIEQVIGHINESSGFFAPHGPLIERIRALDHDLDERFLERGVTDTGAPQAQAAPSPTATVVEEIAEAEDNQEFDAEVAAIFSEEATELLESADRALQGWKSERRNKDLAFELKRQLHTLKGGARMAGIGAMGTLSHELETLVIQIDDGRIASDDRAFEVLQASLDELSHMRDAVGAGRRVASARDVIRRIRALANPATAKVPLAPPAPAAAPKPVAPLAQAPAPRSTAPPAQTPAPRPAAPPPPTASRPIPTLATPAPTPVAPRSPPAPAMSPRAAAPTAAPPPKPEPRKVTVTSKAELVTRTPPPSSRLPPEEEAEEEAEAAPIALPPGREPQPVAERQELARVDADLLDTLLNNAGEVSIFRSRLEQQVSSIDFNLAELSRTVTRLKEQLRKLELETEAQILNRHQDDNARRQDFDPLELDRYSAIQQFTRALAESSSDVGSIQGLLENLTREAHNLLLQQSRVITELQNGLMRTRMVPFQRHVQRLTRLVRQVANETNKKAEFVVEGATGELDRQVLERMLPPFEHMLRNSVVHGIETPEERKRAGKPEAGRI